MKTITKLVRALAVALAAASVGGLGAPSIALSQTADTLRPVNLPSIDVQASRTLIPIARLPFAMTSTLPLPGALSGATSADAALRGIPGVQVANRFNDAIGERITIRGMGARAQFGVRGIRVLIDGIPATMPDGQTTLAQLDASAITSTQVLRGPAGALWGNASGGVVELRTTPLADRFVNVRADRGAFGLSRFSAAGAVAPSDAADVYARITQHDYDGFRPNASSHKTLGMAGAQWRGATNRAWINVHGVDYDAQNPGSLSQVQLDSARFQANPNNVRQKTGENGTHGEVGGGWSRPVGAGQLEISAYGVARELSNPIPPTIIDLTRKAGGVRTVFSSASDSRVVVMAGAEAGLQADDRENHVNTLGSRGALTLDQAERVRYVAPFMQAVFAATSGIDALAALRYDTYSFKASDHLVTASNPDDSGTRTMHAPSVTVGIRVRADNASIYGNYATSFQTPTTTELANRPTGAGGFNPELQPERTRGGEAGATVTWERIQVELAGFIAHVHDALIGFEVPASPGRQYFRNAGKTTNKGIELSAAVAAARNLHFNGSFTNLESRFDEYTAGQLDYSGKDLPGVARYTAHGSALWAPMTQVSLQLDARYSSSVAANDANDARAPAFTLFDVSATSPRIRLHAFELAASAGVSNIADVAYITAVSINAAGSRYFEPGPGRALFVSLTVAH